MEYTVGVMALIQARIDLLKQKLGTFPPDGIDILRSICLHHQRKRGELVDDLAAQLCAADPNLNREAIYAGCLRAVDDATNRAERMGLIVNVNGQYTFRPSDDWHEYLDDALLSTPATGKKGK